MLVFPPPIKSRRLMPVLERLGHTPTICLDSADILSWPGSGTSWLDRSSNDYDFYLGVDGTADTTDPVFTGTVNSLSSYWAFDGSDRFRIAAGNPAAVNNMNKANATFSIIVMVRPVDFGAGQALCGTRGGASTNTGFRLSMLTSSGLLSFIVADTAQRLAQNATIGATAGAWNLLGMSFNEGGGANNLVMFANGATEVFTGSFSVDPTTNATYDLEIGAEGNGSFLLRNGGRMRAFALLPNMLSVAEWGEVWNALKSRLSL